MRERFANLRRRHRDAILVVMSIMLAFLAMSLFESTKPPPQHLTQEDINAAVAVAMASATPAPSWASQAYAVVRPSVVKVKASPALGSTAGKEALGTGVVVTQSGAILTSLHVVKDAAQVKVVFVDGSESSANVVIKQPENDLAVLQPEVIPDDLVPATLAGSPGVGDEVFAVGNPFGIDGSITSGVVSGLGRQYKSPATGETLSNLIQFDAAVNPGNSGGPLVDRNGEVVGIVTGLMNPTGQDVFIGIGLAVPIETAGGALGSPPF